MGVLSAHFADAARHAGSRRSSSAGSRSATRAEDRHLRTVVRRYQGCLSSLDGQSQRLLSLRTGLHGSPRSAASVARILHVSAGREQLLEQMSLLNLQDAGSRGCAGGSTSSTSSPAVPELTSSGPWTTTATGAVLAAGATTAAHGQSTAASASSPAPPRSAGGRSATPTAVMSRAANTSTAEREGTNGNSVSAAVIALFAVLLLALSLVLLPNVRRRLLPALAGIPADHPYWQQRSRATKAVATPSAPERAVAPAAPAAAAPVPAAAPAPAAAPIADTAPKAQPLPELSTPDPQPQPMPEPSGLGASTPTPHASRTDWLREHATQGALVATVIAGGMARILKGGRRR